MTTSKNKDRLSFDLTLNSKEVELTTAEGLIQVYEIRELTGKERDKYLNTLSKRSRTLPDGTTKINNFDNLQADLLTRTMFARVDGEFKAVDVNDLQAWPARVQGELFKLAQSLSGLDTKKDEDEEGND